MTQELATTTATDILTKDQAGMVDEIRTYHAGVRSSYEHQIQYAFMAGVKLEALKQSCPHGNSKDANGEGFVALCAKVLPEISRPSAKRYMDFTRLVIEKKLTVSFIRSSNLLLTNGDLPEVEKKAVLDAVYEAADGKSWTAFYRDLDLVRQKKAHEYHPPKSRTPDEIIAEENEQAAAFIRTALSAIAMLQNDLTSKSGTLALRVQPKQWQELHRATVSLNKLIKPLTKRKSASAKVNRHSSLEAAHV